VRRDKTSPGKLPATQLGARTPRTLGQGEASAQSLSQSLRPETPYAAFERRAASTCSATLPVSSAR
jgi:hypothetical protein